jgi:ATP-dependent RNA/DNA helicase IGHMBP2
MDLAAFARQHAELLELERRAELAEVEQLLRTRTETELEARGVLLRKLVAQDLEPGFGGRLHAVLQRSRGDELPAHRFAPGDCVGLRPSRADTDPGAPSISGVVVRVQRHAITVALDDEDAELPDLLRLEQLAPDVTHRRQLAALRALPEQKRDDRAPLRDVCFLAREPEFAPAPAAAQVPFLDPTLDPAQCEAVALCLRARQLALVHGPPGTGKTTTVVEVIRQAVARGERVLACAPSNVAVDNLTERLAAAAVPVVRLGHPARVLAAVRDLSLASQVAADEEQRVARDLRRELERLQRKLPKTTGRLERRELRDQLKRLRREQRTLETAITQGVLDRARVVLATTTGAADAWLGERVFDLAVVDEAAQAIEAACWIPLLRARRAVLAGDHRQLGPTILSAEAAAAGLARTLFERLADSAAGPAITAMLTVQYRMHERIMGWPDQRLYGSRLRADASVEAHRLADLPGVTATELTEAPLVFVDTAGCGGDETPGDEDGSKQNPFEAELVQKHVAALLHAGVPAAAIGVITPYNAQVQLLRGLLPADQGLEVNTVDGFQGREKEAIVLSLVRSNEHGEVGFLADLRRLNVAITRARRHLAVFADSATLAYDDDLASFVDWCQRHACYRSAFELR